MIKGVVTDERGRPLVARVAVVGVGGGSLSMGTSNTGAFQFGALHEREYVVTASNSAGRISVLSGVRPGVEFRLPPMLQGAPATIELQGLAAARLAVFHEGVRVHDFTLREGVPAPIVVPAGSVRFVVYGEGLSEERTCVAVPGEALDLTLHLGA